MAAPAGLWHNRDYMFYRTSRVTSVFGSRVSGIAYPLLVLSLGGSLVQAGALGSCQLITSTLVKFPGGHLADRYNRRTLMIVMDLARMVAVGTVPLAALLHGLSYPQLLAVAVIEGAGSAMFGPAATVYLREIVPKEHLTKALSQTQATSGAMSLIGPALGGLLYGVDRLLPFTVDFSSYLLSAALLVGVSANKPRPSSQGTDRRATAGVRWLWRQPQLMRVVFFASVINLVSSALTVAVILSLRQHGTSTSAIGVVMACVGIGGISGSLLAQRLIPLGPARLYTAVGIVWAAGIASFAVVFSPFAIGPVLAVMFALSPAAGIMLSRITLDEAPPDLLGRVSTAEQMVSISLATVGPLLAGALLEGVGRSAMWLVLAAVCLLGTVITIVPLIRVARSASAQPEPVSATAE
jgi:predicted MFS family arabinose efflux permease